MISQFNLTRISGDFGFSSLDREEIETVLELQQNPVASAETSSRYRVLILCGGHEGSSAGGQHPVCDTWLLEMSVEPLDLSSAWWLKLEEGQKIISLSRNANKPSRF